MQGQQPVRPVIFQSPALVPFSLGAWHGQPSGIQPEP